ncbi:MAG: YitT family protein [Pseudomonadota bacterium]
MPAPVPFPAEFEARHSILEDVQGLVTGVFLCSFGMTVLTHLGLITGQTAGIAVIISYLTGWSFGICFFVINLPFWWLAWRRMGRAFMVKSLICVSALSIGTELFPEGLRFEELSPILGAVLFGATTGLGLLAVFRHGGSLGGLGVLALIVQDQTGFRAGYVQLIVDGLLFSIALLLFPFSVVAYSLLGAVTLNGLIAFNHRRDWYIAR